jgi:hypothetical protein
MMGFTKISGIRHTAMIKKYSQLNLNLFDKYSDLPPGGGSNPKDMAGFNKWLVGEYWTVSTTVPLSELVNVKAKAISKDRLKSVQQADNLPPIEIAVWKGGDTFLVDGNHRLVSARKSNKHSIEVKFTFPDIKND